MYNNYNEFDFEEKPSKRDLVQQRAKKQKQATMLIALLIVGGLAYFFLGYLPEEKTNAKEEIEKKFKEEWNVTADKLDAKLWEGSENWEEHLEGLLLPSQVQAFKEKMIKAIDNKAIELEEEEKDKPRKMRQEAIDAIEAKYLSPKELKLPEIQKAVEEFTKKINKASVKDIGKILDEASDFFIKERYKRQCLHWERESRSWADRILENQKQDFNSAWSQFNSIVNPDNEDKKSPEKCPFAAHYSIKFPSSLYNKLTEEQKANPKIADFELGNEVSSYKFSSMIEKWENKVKSDPVRGKRDATTGLDNNALFYGAPRTGKSVMAEKIVYETDKYPLVVIKGSALTPTINDHKCSIDNFKKFIFTICDIDHSLADDFSFEREENGEVRYILFIDEANQISKNTLSRESSYLTFLKECMGSDTRVNETENLWIAATNHLDQIDEAVYQSGRLSNILCFSWTLGDFMRYAGDAGIVSQFPEHWLKEKTLSDEDNKWVNRFNKIIFDANFLPFWNTFIANNPNAEYEPEKEENNNEQEQNNDNAEDKKIKIKWGEFFEFFWRLYDSSQLESFSGKFTNPRNPKIERVVEKNLILASNQISKSIDTRLGEIFEESKKLRGEMEDSRVAFVNSIDDGLEQIRMILSEIGGNMEGGSRHH